MTLRPGRAVMLWLGVASGVVCVVTGALWTAVDDAAEVGLFLLVLGLLGGSALVAGGVWQWAAGPKSRVFVLVLIAALAGGDVFANLVGLLTTAASVEVIPGVSAVRWASWVGLVVGGLLYLSTLVAGLAALRERDRALDEPAAR